MTRFFRVIGLEFAAIDGSHDKIKERGVHCDCAQFISYNGSILFFFFAQNCNICPKFPLSIHLPPQGCLVFYSHASARFFLTRKQNGRDSFHLPIFIIRMFRVEGSRGPAPPSDVWINENRCISKEHTIKVCVSWS